MSIRSILVPVQADEQSDARLELAIAVANSFGARLVGFGAPLRATETVVAGYDAGSLMGARYAAAQEELAQAYGKFSAAAEKVTGRSLWRCTVNHPQDLLPITGRAADLIVVQHQSEPLTSPASIPSPGCLALQCGRPILVGPADATALALTNVMVAWKDTREARRALSDALPFLHRAARIDLVAIVQPGCGASAEAALEDVAGGLRLHGLEAQTVVMEENDRTVGDLLVEVANDYSADLVVAGAYGHTRLGEWVFGGVTKTLLQRGNRALLLSH